jgi:hypothetical protein
MPSLRRSGESPRVLLVAALVLAALPACGGDDPPRTVGEDAVLSGIVTRDGEPVAGLRVQVTAWPTDEVLETLGDGDPVPTQELGHVTTDRHGWFVFELDPAEVSSDHLGADGLVDLDVVFGESPWFYGFTAMPNEAGEGGGTWASAHFDDSMFHARASQGKAPMHVIVEIGGDPSLVEDGGELVFWQ